MNKRNILLAIIFLSTASMAQASENSCNIKLQVEDSKLLRDLSDDEETADVRTADLAEMVKSKIEEKKKNYVISEQSDVVLKVSISNNAFFLDDMDPWSFKLTGKLNGKKYTGVGEHYSTSKTVNLAIENLVAALPSCE